MGLFGAPLQDQRPRGRRWGSAARFKAGWHPLSNGHFGGQMFGDRPTPRKVHCHRNRKAKGASALPHPPIDMTGISFGRGDGG